MMKSTQEIQELLIEHKVRPSIYRIKILQCLDDKKLHPTADEIYMNLIEEFPTLSKMSVYNTIQVLLEAGLVRELTIENNEVRYDSLLDQHGHFKCVKCGKVFNFELDMSFTAISGLTHFKIEQKDVFFKGVCPDCQKA